MDYADTLDKASSYLRELELDKGVTLLFKLLEYYPNNIELIQRVYTLEVKRPKNENYQKICMHIFGISSNKVKFHQLIIDTFSEYKKHFKINSNIRKEVLFNLFKHLSNSYLIDEAEKLRVILKQDYAEDVELTELLKYGCQQLIRQNKLIQARNEIKYLISYYAETNAGIWAISVKDSIEANIKK